MQPMEEARPRRILVVDDEPDILDSLKELLEAAIPSVEVVVSTSGADALNILDRGGIGVVVSDFKMPGMNGLDLLQEARRRAPRVPRVLITAFPDLSIALDAINSAAIHSFFTKPLEPDEVVQALQELLSDRALEVQRQQAFARAVDVARRRGGAA